MVVEAFSSPVAVFLAEPCIDLRCCVFGKLYLKKVRMLFGVLLIGFSKKGDDIILKHDIERVVSTRSRCCARPSGVTTVLHIEDCVCHLAVTVLLLQGKSSTHSLRLISCVLLPLHRRSLRLATRHHECRQGRRLKQPPSRVFPHPFTVRRHASRSIPRAGMPSARTSP